MLSTLIKNTMNTNCVLWDPYFNMWNGRDIQKIQHYVKKYISNRFEINVLIPSEKIFYLLSSLTKNMRPKTGDIHTRCLLDDEIPDQFYSKENIISEAIQIIISNIVDDVQIVQDPMTVWNSIYQPDMVWFPKPKIYNRRNKEILSMKF
jgi:hypothetical protein